MFLCLKKPDEKDQSELEIVDVVSPESSETAAIDTAAESELEISEEVI
jgi:hypothetical protein